MSHPLRMDECRREEPLGRPRAAVLVRVEGRDRLIIAGGLFIAKADTLWARLPGRFQVLGPDGNRIEPSPGLRFWISTESFGPFHALLEAELLPM